MSDKRRRQDAQNQGAGGGSGDKRRRRPRKQHLYLVLDDWEKGYSIHKIDPDTFDDSDDEDPQHLPEPPALRLEPPAGDELHTRVSFAALGTKLLALMNHRCGLVYDADTAVLSLGAHAPADMLCGYGDTVAAGDNVLYALSDRYFDREHPQSFEAMSWGPTAPDARQQPTEGWSWQTLPPPPFPSYARAIAPHPDGHTIFITSTDDKQCMATYSFDTVDSSWRCHGNWALPFLGHGHFDAELDAWVGLDMDGHVCACQVVSPSFRCTAPCFYPDCKVTQEKMLSNRNVRDALTYMDASKYCILDGFPAKMNADRRPTYGSHDGCVIKLTVFGLKYNHRGELQIKHHRSTRSFLVSRHLYHFTPQTFWV
ncbi:unnamed protein product [Urochloa decumbens]|uniref:Uncharacterized protein n=1 Tax=Urochloa decumbens TaxID=240449 RepID=A0ABC9BVL4_9POAL